MLYAMKIVTRKISYLCVIQKHSFNPWERVWRNVNHATISERVKSTWYAVIHEIVLPNERLAAIRLTDTDI
jgi:ABC-type nitrate/sulfonate/bicarbonate transport system ATPase subunit